MLESSWISPSIIPSFHFIRSGYHFAVIHDRLRDRYEVNPKLFPDLFVGVIPLALAAEGCFAGNEGFAPGEHRTQGFHSPRYFTHPRGYVDGGARLTKGISYAEE